MAAAATVMAITGRARAGHRMHRSATIAASWLALAVIAPLTACGSAQEQPPPASGPASAQERVSDASGTRSSGCRLGAARLVPLPLLPVALNAHGEVLGIDAEHRAARWRSDTGLALLPLPRGFERAEPVALNDAGLAVAVAVAGAGGSERRRPYAVVHGQVVILGGAGARPFRIDAAGRVAGEAVLEAAEGTQPVLWQIESLSKAGSNNPRHISHGMAPVLMPLPLAACCGGTAKLLDGQGGVAGDLYDSAGRYHAVRWRPAQTPEPLQSGDGFSSALAMNRHGDVVFIDFPHLWLAGPHGLEHLSLAPRRASHPHALNDCDELVGDVGPYSDAARAFLWNREQGFIDLNDRIDRPAGWTLKSAVDVNDRGQIVGRAELPGDLERGFLIQPIDN
jgi:hypothetical protein